MTSSNASSPLPEFEVRLPVPDLSDWLPGNTGIPGVTSRDSGEPGPHVALLALTHGNEYAGGIVLDRLLRHDLRPAAGRLSFVFVNYEAFARFDPRRPTLSRFIDEDLNRLWDEAVLQGPRHSVELNRARELCPLLDTVDVLLDLHSMLWPSDPLILSGACPKGRRLAMELSVPNLVVADAGHLNGRRIIDYTRFSDPDSPYVANLVEAGQHWEAATVDTAMQGVLGLLRHVGMTGAQTSDPPPRTPSRFARVTHAVTALTSGFVFERTYYGGEVIPDRDTLIAHDGEAEIRTPYDNCLLIMPSLRPSRGHTAVRLARFEEG
ncbi:MAG: succinylglutamate desuccinylase/aspartoacylase family protein [Acetobacteraceae bacterium]